MSKRYRFRPLLTDAHYHAIGRAIATWASLEIKLDEQLLRMLNHEKAIPLRTRQNIHDLADVPKSLRARLDLSDELAKTHYSGQTLRQLLAITKRCKALSKERNRLAHGEWIIEFLPKKPPKLVSRMRRHGTPGKQRIFSVPQIRQKTHDFCEVIADLHDFMINHHPQGSLEERARKIFQVLRESPTP